LKDFSFFFFVSLYLVLFRELYLFLFDFQVVGREFSAVEGAILPVFDHFFRLWAIAISPISTFVLARLVARKHRIPGNLIG